MTFLVPAGTGQAEHTERRSRFIGHVLPVEREEQAREQIARIKAAHHDARHNCWCYLLRGGVVRYADDGEPQGTAGVPMLEVFQREGVTDLCCVVTRYFGGILLGAGGLARAYTKAAKDALVAAGIAELRRWDEVTVTCPYPLLERIKLEVRHAGGTVEGIVYAEHAALRALLPETQTELFTARVTELTAGGCVPAVLGQVFRAAAPILAADK